jgi:hypothetical protein
MQDCQLLSKHEILEPREKSLPERRERPPPSDMLAGSARIGETQSRVRSTIRSRSSSAIALNSVSIRRELGSPPRPDVDPLRDRYEADAGHFELANVARQVERRAAQAIDQKL